MTIIAVRDGVMAADQGEWYGGYLVAMVPKIVSVPNRPAFVACSGSLTHIVAFETWWKGGGDKPSPVPDAEFDALELTLSGVFRYTAKFDKYRINHPFIAIGSHWEFVMGAMAAGASAPEAVALAIRHGDAAAGEPQVARLDER